MQEQTNTTSIKLIFGFSLVLLLVVGGFGMYFLSNQNNQSPQTQNPPTTVIPTIFSVPFQYQIKSIDQNTIILAGDNGDMTLPNDPAAIVVYSANQELLTLDQLQVNQKLNLDLVPGQKATIYLQN